MEQLEKKYSLPQPPAEAHYTVYMLKDPEGKVYIGCTGKPVEERWKKGLHYTYRSHISRAIRSIGWENFEKKILCEKLTREGAEKLEKWFIAYYDSANPEKGYNRELGGLGKGTRVSEAVKKTVSEAISRKYEEDPEYRERVSKGIREAYENDPEYREKVSRGHLEAYEKDPGYRERVSKGIREAYENDPEYRERVSRGIREAYENDPGYAARSSSSKKRHYREHPERREEIRQRMKEYLSNPENRAFIDADNHPKPVICVETGVAYPSQKAAERATGLSKIHEVCSGRYCTAGGYHWRNVQ